MLNIRCAQFSGGKAGPLTYYTWMEVCKANRAIDFVVHFQNNEPIILRKYGKGYVEYRLASDEASAVQMKRIRAQFPNLDAITQLSSEDMMRKINELMAAAVAEDIDRSLTGE